jgi:hypothetical protein
MSDLTVLVLGGFYSLSPIGQFCKAFVFACDEDGLSHSSTWRLCGHTQSDMCSIQIPAHMAHMTSSSSAALLIRVVWYDVFMEAHSVSLHIQL